MTRRDDNPAAVYRDSLSRGSFWAVHHSLETMAKLLDASGPWSYPWHRLRYHDTARVRAQLVERYAPATVNRSSRRSAACSRPAGGSG